MADQLKNLMIGLFVTAAIFIVVFIMLFLHPRIGDEGKLLHARFTDIDKVTIGTRVTYGGKPVGEVVDIKLIGDGRNGPRDEEGHIYLYDLALRVDSGIDVYNTDEISLRTSGLLGEKSVQITPHAPVEGQLLELIGPIPVYAASTTSVEETFKDLKLVGEKIEKMLDSATKILNKIDEEKIVEKVSHTMSHIESITGSLDNSTEWKETLTNIHTLSARVLKSWDSVDVTLGEISGAANNARVIMERTHRGEGTLGKLLSNDEIYLRTNSIMSKLETTLDDVNHYGLMFHSDKGWQRLRARRMNLMQTLRTPQEFRNYFNDEINQISTSLARVHMVWTDIGADPYCCNMMANPEYTKVFADLMRRVSMLDEEVHLYNTQVAEVGVHTTELGNPPLCPECIYDDQWQQNP
jgi:phospholipid/cholesterol/gamma-HCH transport system substrate-binding protein